MRQKELHGINFKLADMLEEKPGQLIHLLLDLKTTLLIEPLGGGSGVLHGLGQQLPKISGNNFMPDIRAALDRDPSGLE